ncbi:uncharacterized protein LOC115054690 isoform X2 [Echeneis naucrates]|nr:uncharacterized protein LOC115054690 isoform X2 [Echeneis naucrates]XP_029375876.1 uncharacterized protein LOC115054690 isoform X2 [Echeneis naucrates]
MKIQEDGGFRNPNITEDRPPLVWWSLNLRPEDITSAEARFLQNKYPDLITPQAQAEARFLEHFATSPAFLKTSRLGSYRFTVSVEDVLNAYSQQFCSGAAPVLRAFETILYKKEVMYVVLVHSPDHQQYEDYPLLGDDPGTVCYYRDGQFIWTAQAMCSTHRYELVKIPEENQFRADKLNRGIYYIWDNVAIALHMEKDQVLKFDPDKLSVTPCEQDEIVYRDNFDSLKEAEGHIKRSPWRLLKRPGPGPGDVIKPRSWSLALMSQ